MDFYLPGFHAGIGDDLYPEGSERAGEPLSVGRVFHAVTPATLYSSYYFFGLANADPDHLARAKEALNPVIDEDVFASEETEKMLQTLDHSPAELMIKSDRGAVEARRILQTMMDEERAATVSV